MNHVTHPLISADISIFYRKLGNYLFTANSCFIANSNSLLFIANFLFHSTRKRKDIPNILPPFHIDNVPVKREFVTKFLGVYLDENINISSY